MRFLIRNNGLYLMNYDLSKNTFKWSSYKIDAIFTTENGIKVLLIRLHNSGFWNAHEELV